ncbi:MAG: FtsX-like permease family protein, partial [Candidatus Aenigmarchaeota archaeon]|nr:FtsX-like permease family protein [Candidatus Aenigmarchaeota archaeon]
KEIGIMKAIGAKNRDIMMIFMLNSALVGFVGGVFGVVVGTLASGLMDFSGDTATAGIGGGMGRMFGSTLVTPSLVFYAMAISIGIGMVAGLIPAYRASKLKPVDALRYE